MFVTDDQDTHILTTDAVALVQASAKLMAWAAVLKSENLLPDLTAELRQVAQTLFDVADRI